MSGTEPLSIIRIRASAKRNGFTSLLIGFVGFFISWLLLARLPDSMFLLGIFISCLSIVAILIGWFKLREPSYSLALSPLQLLYLHRCGRWSLDWQNIQRIDIPRVSKGLHMQDMELVGIRLKRYQPLLESISPRLATNILMEQRPLLQYAQSQDCATGNCYSDNLIEDDRYRLDDGKVVTGVTAMLANRMTKLRQALGYDLFIPATELDRPIAEFVTLLRQCKAKVDSQVAHKVTNR